jgi:hypothetical protein
MTTKAPLKICDKCLCYDCQNIKCKEVACSICNLDFVMEKCEGFIGEDKEC